MMNQAESVQPHTFQPFRPCRACHRQRGEHTPNGKCLYGPGWYRDVQGNDFVEEWMANLLREWEGVTP